MRLTLADGTSVLLNPRFVVVMMTADDKLVVHFRGQHSYACYTLRSAHDVTAALAAFEATLTDANNH